MTAELWAALMGRAVGAALAFTLILALAITSRPAVSDHPDVRIVIRPELTVAP